MLHPTIEELTHGQYNRYELALATAKCARLVTDEYVHQREAAERAAASNKEAAERASGMVEKELRDEKAVHVAVNYLKDGKYVIDLHACDDTDSAADEPTVTADEQADASTAE